ncbi:LLM class flavin-dependent oxidoreductase [Oligoflexus tunisiensis]|uniref:LLM class flavin-dependent oxidoreductase n=1 Tax=Oligoflexus tunisiensis TaxID=708132 RepID=UPI000A900E41|nr:LLM class flavin-dependent oxidoreductase [Oligoflexus tunisiensis]
MSLKTPFSVLDLAMYAEGKTIADAFAATRDLAQHAEKWGYSRYWLAEHHNLEGIASSATAVLIGFVAAHTQTIRVGSGGIMLPNHAPLMVAEQFGTLETLYPGRIDLGLGRAPGTDQTTMRALRKEAAAFPVDFADLIEELLFYFAPAQPGQRVKAIPGAGLEIPLWILGSSHYSARLAAALGRPYAFAGHFAPQEMIPAIRLYQAEFRPSRYLKKPKVMVGVAAVAADTDERAHYLATSLYRRLLSLIRGNLKPSPPPVESMQGLWTPQEEQAVRQMTSTMVIGGPRKVAEGLQQLIARTGADELIITSDLYAHEDRLRSFELLSQLIQPD